MKEEQGKEYRTRDGRKAGVYSRDNGGAWPVHGWVEEPDGSKLAAAWRADGVRYANGAVSGYDLVEVRPRIKRAEWLNVYATCSSGSGSREEAELRASVARLACIRVDIDCPVGEGLDEA